MSLTEVSEATNLSRPTARRLLLTLQDRGYVSTSGRLFALTPRVLALGYAYLSSLNLTETAQPFMEEVVARTGEGCSLATLDGTDVVYVTRVPTHRVASLNLAVGTRLPAHATSMGHVLLADLTPAQLDQYFKEAELVPLTHHTLVAEERIRERLAEVRRQGWAMVDQELENGVRSIAAPVRDVDGRTIAAMSLSTATTRTTAAALREDVVPVLVHAAGEVSARLGASASRR